MSIRVSFSTGWPLSARSITSRSVSLRPIMPAAPVMRMCMAFPSALRAELGFLPPIPIEILRREPALERGLPRRPLAVEHGKPGGVAASALDDHVRAEQPLIGEAETLRRPARGGVEGVALPFVAAVTERLEGVARDQVLCLGAERRALQRRRVDDVA